jgi:xyloglucan-specific endo-beta-1,4-glucanase
MRFSSAALLLAAAAAPVPLALAQTQSLCDTQSYYSSNGYYFSNDEWNAGAGTGSGCLDVTDAYSTGVVFDVQWSWSGGDGSVKSYPHVGVDIATGRSISSIGSLATEAYWSYSGSGISADVSYDLFTASDPNHDTSYGDYELMVWYAKHEFHTWLRILIFCFPSCERELKLIWYLYLYLG